LFFSIFYFGKKYFNQKGQEKYLFVPKFRDKLSSNFFKKSSYPEKINVEDIVYKVSYTVNKKLESYIKKLLRRYKTDYTAIVVIDNNSGKILSAVGYSGINRQYSKNNLFSSTHPSASLFKIITAANLMEGGKLKGRSEVEFVGRSSTLYKYQLKNRVNRFKKIQTIRNAFAKSNNVIFGKLAINYLSGIGLFKTASSFGFNRRLMQEINIGKSYFMMPNNQYNLAELASGFNKRTMISPVHAALISLIVANEGELIFPSIVEKIIDPLNGKEVNFKRIKPEKIYSKNTANELSLMMRQTIIKGTARKSFKNMKNKLKTKLFIGGKTGSITGGLPYGKRDWFTAYAKPVNKHKKNGGISLAVMNINKKRWYVRSSYLAKKIIEYYYINIEKIGIFAASR